MNNQAGKGSKVRPFDPKKFGEGYDRIYKEKKKKKKVSK